LHTYDTRRQQWRATSSTPRLQQPDHFGAAGSNVRPIHALGPATEGSPLWLSLSGVIHIERQPTRCWPKVPHQFSALLPGSRATPGLSNIPAAAIIDLPTC
jgi:hypothetical protein